MSKIKSYILSVATEQDLDKIFDKSEEDYGFDHAVNYMVGLSNLIDELVTHPEMGTHRPEIREGLRGMPYEHHLILYRILEDRIRIVRVVGGSMDLPNLSDLQ